jgi:hypothetical protein
MRRLFGILVLAAAALPASADELPPLPFIIKDICPTSRCAYGTWIAARDLTAYQFEGNLTRPAFKLAPNERFLALTGNIHTFKPGKALVMETFTDPPESRNPYDRFQKDSWVFLLAPRGEGYYEVWIHGRHRGVKLPMAESAYFMPGRDQVKLVERGTWTWWVYVKNRAGQKGWLSFPGIVTSDVKGLQKM